MIRVNMLGRVCGYTVLLAFAVVVYQLHALANSVERDQRLRQAAREMLRDDQAGQSKGPVSGEIAGAPHQRGAASENPDVATHLSESAQPTQGASGHWAELEELHREWDMYVVNLDKRPDRLACAMQEFNRLGMRPNRLRGIDGTQLNFDQLSFVTPEAHAVASDGHGRKHGFAGHKGCLYSHIEFLLRAVGQTDCFVPQYIHSLKPDPNIGEVTIMVTNRAQVSLRVYRVSTEGQEISTSQAPDILPSETAELSSGVNEVWRFRAVPVAKGLPERLLGEILVDRYPATRQFVITDCPGLTPPADTSSPASKALKGAIMFEDDVVFDRDFVPRFLKASAALPDDWDVLVLNWYCMGTHPVSTGNIAGRLKEEMQKMTTKAEPSQSPTESTGRRLQEHLAGAGADASIADAHLLQDLLAASMHSGVTDSKAAPAVTRPKNPTSWTQYCEKNRQTPEIVPGSGLVRAHFFMSGSAFAVSANGARKILESFPCHDVGHLKCSPAFDWHLSTLVERGLVNAYGMLPEAVWMPKQGELLGVEAERYTVPSAVRTSASCIAYTSDIFGTHEKTPEDADVGSVSEDHARAAAIEQTVYEYRAALRRQRGDDAKKKATKEDADGDSRLTCELEENVVFDKHSHADGAEETKHLYDLKLGRPSDCCLACIAEPLCNSWSIMGWLRYCQLSEAEVVPPGSNGQSLGRTPAENIVSGRVVRRSQ